MSAKKFVKDYLSFGKNERIAIIALFAIMCFIYFLPQFYPHANESFPEKEGTALVKALDTLEARQENTVGNIAEEGNTSFYQYEPSGGKNFSTGELFQFDPNTLNIQGWIKLGLHERTARTIDNFRNKGGRFYKPEDLKKIWGMPAGFYERVKDYIKITTTQKPAEASYSKPGYEKSERKIALVPINTADTSAFIALPGIGSKLAARIVNFREKLGGFYSVEQVAETYGLPDSTFTKIKIYLQNDAPVKKINVNVATKEELKVHPYIKWKLANAIVEYRNQHGNFKSIGDLKNIVLIDAETFQRISHYLSL